MHFEGPVFLEMLKSNAHIAPCIQDNLVRVSCIVGRVQFVVPPYQVTWIDTLGLIADMDDLDLGPPSSAVAVVDAQVLWHTIADCIHQPGCADQPFFPFDMTRLLLLLLLRRRPSSLMQARFLPALLLAHPQVE